MTGPDRGEREVDRQQHQVGEADDGAFEEVAEDVGDARGAGRCGIDGIPVVRRSDRQQGVRRGGCGRAPRDTDAALQIRRFEPDDVAHAVAMLIDERSGFITGQVLYVCGGMTVGLGHAA